MTKKVKMTDELDALHVNMQYNALHVKLHQADVTLSKLAVRGELDSFDLAAVQLLTAACDRFERHIQTSATPPVPPIDWADYFSSIFTATEFLR